MIKPKSGGIDYDNEEQIGGGTHERAIVWTSKFLDRVQAKLDK